MSDSKNPDATFEPLLNNGRFYYPAWRHYDKVIVNVVCDRCHKINLDCSVGHETLDLCMECANIIATGNFKKYDANKPVLSTRVGIIKNAEMTFELTINNGDFYFPAWKHYNDKTANIQCDRCHKINLACCVGADINGGKIDLCMECTVIIAAINIKNYGLTKKDDVKEKPKNPETIHALDLLEFSYQDYGPPLTRMLQDAFTSEASVFSRIDWSDGGPERDMTQTWPGSDLRLNGD